MMRLFVAHRFPLVIDELRKFYAATPAGRAARIALYDAFDCARHPHLLPGTSHAKPDAGKEHVGGVPNEDHWEHDGGRAQRRHEKRCQDIKLFQVAYAISHFSAPTARPMIRHAAPAEHGPKRGIVGCCPNGGIIVAVGSGTCRPGAFGKCAVMLRGAWGENCDVAGLTNLHNWAPVRFHKKVAYRFAAGHRCGKVFPQRHFQCDNKCL